MKTHCETQLEKESNFLHSKQQSMAHVMALPKTFRSKNGLSVNWPKLLRKLIALKEDGELDKLENLHALARSVAGNWVTCACGNMCDVIPRSNSTWFNSSEPIDVKLATLGMRFYGNIKDQHYKRAMITLHSIEKRSGEIIKEMKL